MTAGSADGSASPQASARAAAGVRLRAFGATSLGLVREANEDSYHVGDTVFAVADGMGGHAAGEVASEAALEPVRGLEGRRFRDPRAATDALAQALVAANDAVFTMAAADPELRGMGTTLTAVLQRDGRLHLAHVGDSRAYLYRDHALQQITQDHTLIQQLIDEGRLTAELAVTHPQRSVITRAIGVDPAVEVDTLTSPLELLAGDRVLLCSDGLTGPVDDAAIAAILRAEPDGQAACLKLLDAANAGGGPDNITVVLLVAEGDAATVPPVPDDADDDATAELVERDADDTVPPAPATVPAPSGFDAGKLSRLGADVDDRPPQLRSGRGRRLLSAGIGALLLLGVLGAGGWVIISRAYFVGIDEGQVTIFRGLQQEILGVPLRTVVDRTPIAAGALPVLRRERLEEGISFPSLAEARTYASETLRREAAEPEPASTPQATGTPATPPATAPPAASAPSATRPTQAPAPTPAARPTT